MKAANIILAVKNILTSNTGLSPMIVGKPGVGKSAIVYQVARELGLQVVEFRPCLHDPIDLMGIPANEDGKTTWLTPSWLPTSGEGILFIDEFPQATPAMQNALSQLIYGRKIGKYTLPKGWKIVLAGNRQSDKAATYRMPSHINDRVAFLHLEYSVSDWIEWAIDNALPSVMIAFAQFRPQIMNEFDPNRDVNCTPRSFSESAPFIDFPQNIRYDVLAGTIGEGPAVEFEAFTRVWESLDTFEHIIENASTIEIPTKTDVLYATVQMLVENTTVDNLSKVDKYISRLEPEMSVVFYRMFIQMNTKTIGMYELLKLPEVDRNIDKITSITKY